MRPAVIANAIVYYNSAILSRLLQKFEAGGNENALAVVKSVSPAAWRPVHLNGHYTFRGAAKPSTWMRSSRVCAWSDASH